MELGLSMYEILTMRGWRLKLEKSGNAKISYRKTEQALVSRVRPDKIATYCHISTIMDRIFQMLNAHLVFNINAGNETPNDSGPPRKKRRKAASPERNEKHPSNDTSSVSVSPTKDEPSLNSFPVYLRDCPFIHSPTHPKILCLGMTYPDIRSIMKFKGLTGKRVLGDQFSPDFTPQFLPLVSHCVKNRLMRAIDGRNLARCGNMEKKHSVTAYTVSLVEPPVDAFDDSTIVCYSEQNHVNADFNKPSLVRVLREKFGDDVKFEQINLDHYYSSVTGDNFQSTLWENSLFSTSLPLLASLLDDPLANNDPFQRQREKGVVFLPMSFYILKHLLAYSDSIRQQFSVSFVHKDCCQSSCLFYSGTETIPIDLMNVFTENDRTMENRYQYLRPEDACKETDDCNFHLDPDLFQELCVSLNPHLDHIRLIRLTKRKQCSAVPEEQLSLFEHLYQDHHPLFPDPTKPYYPLPTLEVDTNNNDRDVPDERKNASTSVATLVDDKQTTPKATRKRKKDDDKAAYRPQRIESSKAMFNRKCEALQLGLLCVQYIFGQLIDTRLDRDHSYVFCLFHVVFEECEGRREVLDGVLSLFMFCPTYDSVTTQNRKTLLSWMYGDPSQIRTRAQQATKMYQMDVYKRSLLKAIHDTFKKSHMDPDHREDRKNFLIVRWASFVLMEEMNTQRDKNKTEKTYSPLTSFRNIGRHGNQKRDIVITRPQCVKQHYVEPFFSEADFSMIYGPTSRIPQSPSSVTPCSTATQPTLESPNPCIPSASSNEHLSGEVMDLLSRKPSVREPTIAEQPFLNNVKIATMVDVGSVHHRFVVELKDLDIHLFHQPVEVYHTFGLHDIDHVYENNGTIPFSSSPCDDTRVTVTISRNLPHFVSRSLPQLAVIRPQSETFKSCFNFSEAFVTPSSKIFNFMIRNGKPDSNRSDGYRIDFGCGGQGKEKLKDGTFRPDELYGLKKITDATFGVSFLDFIGKVGEGCCRASDSICQQLGLPYHRNEKRYTTYADQLRDKLFAKFFYFEHVTIQLLNLTRLQKGKRHKDRLNDSRSSYNRVVVWVSTDNSCLLQTCKQYITLTHDLSFFTQVSIWIDEHGEIWALKVIFTFRKCIGDYFTTKYSNVDKVLANVNAFKESVNLSYASLYDSYRGGCFPDAEPPTFDNPERLCIDSNCPWTTKVIPTNLGPINQRYFQLLTGPCRGYWLSLGLTSIHCMMDRLSMDGCIELLICLAWQNSLEHFHIICSKMDITHCNRNGAIIYEYQHQAKRHFQDLKAAKNVGYQQKSQYMYGGPDARFSSASIDFEDLFGTKEDPKIDLWRNVVNVIGTLLFQINQVVTDEAIPITPELVHDTILNQCTTKLKSIAPCQLGPFRLMLLVQSAAHLGIGIRSHQRLPEIFIPIKGFGSYNHLRRCGISEKDCFPCALEISREINKPMIGTEAALCESIDRDCRKVDTFFYGQSIFDMLRNGTSNYRPFEGKDWLQVPYKKLPDNLESIGRELAPLLTPAI